MPWSDPEQKALAPAPRPTIADRYAQGSGAVLDTREGVAEYLRDLTAYTRELHREMDRCREWLRMELAQAGVSSAAVQGVGRLEVKRKTERTWDIEILRELPEVVFNRIVEETVTYNVRWAEAKRASAANPEYAAIIGRALTGQDVHERVYVSV